MARVKLLVIVLAVVLILVGLSSPTTAGGQNELKALAGTWTRTAITVNGEAEGGAGVAETMTFANGKYSYPGGDPCDANFMCTGTVVVDGAKRPRTMDLVSNTEGDKGKARRCIYELKGNELKIAMINDALAGQASNQARPTAFSGKNVRVYTFVRSK